MEFQHAHDNGIDIEKKGSFDVTQAQTPPSEEATQTGWWKQFTSYGVELRGIEPVPVEQRTDTRTFSIFSLWWTFSVNLLPITTGLVGTLYMGLSLKAACLVILFFNLLGGLPPAAFSILGPKTGMRQLVQSRYSFGLYFVAIASIMSMATATGWAIVSTVIAGQTLSAVSGGSLSWNVGIVIISVASLVVAFMGYKVVHAYERWAWIPALVAILFATGCGGHLLANQAPTAPVTAQGVLSFACTVSSFTMTWAIMASDFSVYVTPDASKARLFAYVYCGLLVPTIPLMCLGAAIGGAIPSFESWTAAMDEGSTGGVMLEMMESTGGFGKFVAVVLAFSLLGNIGGTLYAITVQFQILLPLFARVPRYVFAVVVTGVVIGTAVPVSHTLLVSLENFLGVIAYWAAVFIGVVGTEFLYFRGRDFASYDHAIWNVASRLPPGFAAVGAVTVPFALIVPCMAQAWYTGPIGKKTGDIGYEVGLVLSVLVYIPLRTWEKRTFGR
ncbi:hypothetical protein PV08_01093 [Exophiala spinifera]|uniref:NCS1 nucleoside transporter n=1 Tax=Exophiala spinifera TaxID=91928 RepID=A0A0D2BNR1_9EURO|nr:uncharacterized protein PV08_01093 [Exophiala spinifera]KIW20518.1 hypothetical protein PV08_01093 [Exophiala spinifera]